MARNKQQRQQAIKQLITTNKIQKQEELVDLLNEQGWEVTQATVSRDIASMQLVKVPLETGGFAYAMMNGTDYLAQLGQILHEDTSSMAYQANMIMVRVAPGTGPALKNALEACEFTEVFGVIGDDAGALIVLKTAINAANFVKKLQSLPG